MAIKKYTNIESINNKTDNEGKFIQPEDLFIISKSKNETDFGESKHDVMEVSVYDVNNNLLPHKSGNTVAYIQTTDIKNYMYSITNKSGLKELAIDIEKLLNDLGFTNGILKVNINFVRHKVGTENEQERVWIQEISPSREEIRILPLKTKSVEINNKTKKQFEDLQSLNKNFKYYKISMLNLINSFENTFLSKIDSTLESKYGKDFFNVLKSDFGLSSFSKIRDKMFSDFKSSVDCYLNNKYYDITQSTFGKPAELRFDDYEIYDNNMIISEIQSILNICISYNLKAVKRRDTLIKTTPIEFGVVELKKQIENNLASFNTFSEVKRNVYYPDGTSAQFDDTDLGLVYPKIVYPKKGEVISYKCSGYDRYAALADGNGGTYDSLIEVNSKICGYTPPVDRTPIPPKEGGYYGDNSGGGKDSDNLDRIGGKGGSLIDNTNIETVQTLR